MVEQFGPGMLPGVHIVSGARDWQIFSRDDDGTALVALRGVARPARISPEPPFTFGAIPDATGVAVAAICIGVGQGMAVVLER